MNDNRPNGPETATGSPTGEDRRFPPNSQDPSRVDVGFPTGAVEALRIARRQADETIGTLPAAAIVAPEALDAVLAWIDRYVPREVNGIETSLGQAIGELIIEGEDELFVELIRFNGRTFVEETPTIVGDPLNDHFEDELNVGRVLIDLAGYEPHAAAVLSLVRVEIDEPGCVKRDMDAKFVEALAMTPCAVPGCVRDDPDHAKASPFPAAGAFHGVAIVEEPTDAEGRFPGDIGYVRPS